MSNDQSTSGGLFGRAFDMLRTDTRPDSDQDDDGVTDTQERRLGTDPRKADTDGDGMSDLHEVYEGRDPLIGTPGAGPLNDYRDPRHAGDDDGDGLRNIEERMYGTDAARRDTDGDGRGDFQETMGERDGLALDPTAVDSLASGLDRMVASARSAIGTDYRRGAEASARDADPDAFDSSELVEWAAERAGVDLPDGSWRQYQHLHEAGADLTIDEALRTKGALLFHFDSDPLAADGRPAGASVVISMGDGTVIHASETAGEVVRMSADSYDFTHAAAIPDLHPVEMSDGPPAVEVPAEIDDPTFVPEPDTAPIQSYAYDDIEAYADEPVDDVDGYV